jgi:hypothetical protein
MENEVEDSLELALRDAFQCSSIPKRPITNHNCPECAEVDALLGDRSWSEVAADFPEYCHDVFPLLTPSAQAYYLPAWMLLALSPQSAMQGVSLESALIDGQLSPKQFTAAQHAAILQWASGYWRSMNDSDPPPEFVALWQLAPD